MSTTAIDTSDREIVSIRVFDFPRERVFEAWTDPVLLAQWWGPKGFTNTFHVFESKAGGTWSFIMHGPDGTNYKNESIFVEVSPDRIVFDHVSAPHFRVTATFEDLGGRTQVTFRMLFNSAAECDRLRALCVPSNEENFDRLEALLNRK